MKGKINIKRIIVLIAFSIILFTTNVYASDVDDMADLKSVFTGATVSGNKLTLDRTYDLEENAVTIISGIYEIDLNGYNISSEEISAIEVYDGDLTISNTGPSVGMICANEDWFAAPVYIEGGRLTINSGKLGNSASDSDSVPASDCGLYIAGGTVIIENGEFAGLKHGVYIEDGNITVNDGVIKSTSTIQGNDAIGIFGGTVTINGGTFTSSTSYNDGGVGLYAENTYADTSVVVNNGIFTGRLFGAEFYKETDDELSIAINGGTFTGNHIGLALFEDILSNVQISAGTFKSKSTTSSERLGGIAIGYETTVPEINSIIKTGSVMYPSTTSTSSYVFDDYQYEFLRTADEVKIGAIKTISIPDSIHGTITADKQSAIAGEEITLTVTPESGYKLKQMSVVDRFGEMPVTVTNNKFTMPSYNVIISAEFEEDTDYVFTEGANGNILKTSKDNLEFRINAEYSLLNKVYIDNNELSQDEFSSRSGSTIIGLKNSYLKTLALGQHTLKVSFTDGKEVTTNFEIISENEKDETPKTGTNNYIEIGTLIVTISALGISALRKENV